MTDSYIPGTEEKDPKKVIMALQQQARTTAANGTSITTLQTDVDAAETAITALQAATQLATASVAGIGKKIRVAHIQDQKSNGTAGGTFTASAWQTRALNTEVSDADSIVSISSDRFTLGAGTYIAIWDAPGYLVGVHRTRLYNFTDTAVVAYGGNSYSDPTNEGQTASAGWTVFTIAGTKAFEIQHWCSNTRSSNGFGNQLSASTVEVYANVLIVQIDP